MASGFTETQSQKLADLTLNFAFHFKPVFKIVCSGQTLLCVHKLEGLHLTDARSLEVTNSLSS